MTQSEFDILSNDLRALAVKIEFTESHGVKAGVIFILEHQKGKVEFVISELK